MKFLVLALWSLMLSTHALAATTIRIRAEGTVSSVAVGNEVAIGDRLVFTGRIFFSKTIPSNFNGEVSIYRTTLYFNDTNENGYELYRIRSNWTALAPRKTYSDFFQGSLYSESFYFVDGNIVGFRTVHADEVDPTWIFGAFFSTPGTFSYDDSVDLGGLLDFNPSVNLDNYICYNGNCTSSKFTGELRLVSAYRSVPEPETWLMLLLGFGLMGAVQRNGKKLAMVIAAET